jgi:DNA polymerase-3 subunit beta
MPITGHLLLSATDDHITITTNLETTVIAQCPASVSEAGTVTLPGKKLYEVLKELSGEEIRLSHNTKKLETKLECNGSRVRLIGMPPEEFPAIPSHPATPLFSLPQEDLHRLLREPCLPSDTKRGKA